MEKHKQRRRKENDALRVTKYVTNKQPGMRKCCFWNLNGISHKPTDLDAPTKIYACLLQGANHKVL